MNGDEPDAPARPDLPPRVVLARRVEFSLIAIGGCFLILGWGIGHNEWARAVGWLFTGVGFAIEMVYGKVVRAARAQPEPAPDLDVSDEPSGATEDGR